MSNSGWQSVELFTGLWEMPGASFLRSSRNSSQVLKVGKAIHDSFRITYCFGHTARLIANRTSVGRDLKYVLKRNMCIGLKTTTQAMLKAVAMITRAYI